MRVRLGVLMACVVMAPLPLIAHHSFAAVFDQDQTINLEGTVTEVEWMNPHIWFYLDVRSAEGNVTNWQCEGGNPNVLVRQGWSRDTLKPGDQVSVEGFRARDGSDTCNARVVVREGRRLFAGSSFEEQ